jgi:polysaccharide biosynthesis protein PslG
MPKIRSLLPLLLLVLTFGAGSLPASAAASSPYGVNVHAPQGATLAAQLDRVKAAGIGWVRIDFIWAAVQPDRDTWDWSAYDAIAAAARKRKIEVYATLAYTPGWATDGPEIIGVPRDPADWAEFCSRAAKRYKSTIRTWGMWNEPNLPRFWAGSREEYVDAILKPGADAIHAAVPNARAAGPDLAHVTTGSADWYNWLRLTLLEAGDRLDIITHHLYDTDGSRDVTSKLEKSTTFGSRPSLWDAVNPSVREVLKTTAWYRQKPFWLTETGWESARISEDRQAANYTGLLGDWFTGGGNGRDWVNKVFFYELQDPPTDFTWGLLRADGTLKPAYGAFKSFIRAHPAGR